MPRRKKETCENNAKRHSSRPGSTIKEKPIQRNAANARERARMRVLSRAFCRLKTSLPWVPPDTKLSKLDTLRLTTSYIAHLKGILQDDDPYKPAEPMHPAMSLTWPFGFNRLGAGGSGGGGSEEDEEDDEGSNCSSWEEVRTRLVVGRADCVHLDGTPTDPGIIGNNPVHPSHSLAYQHHHLPINTNTLLSSSYQENILSFS